MDFQAARLNLFEFTQRIVGIVRQSNLRLILENGEPFKLRKLAEAEIRKIGTTEFAGRTNLDATNWLKMIEGKRVLLASVYERLKAYFFDNTLIR